MFFQNIDEILRFAIDKEESSASFYQSLASRVSRPWMREAFEEFAREELGHKARLEAVLSGVRPVFTEGAPGKVTDLRIGDYLADVEPTPDMEYQEALILAMKMEKLAFKLYTDVADLTQDPAMKALLSSLAQEEAKHKLRFELEYDQYVNQEN